MNNEKPNIDLEFQSKDDSSTTKEEDNKFLKEQYQYLKRLNQTLKPFSKDDQNTSFPTQEKPRRK